MRAKRLLITGMMLASTVLASHMYANAETINGALGKAYRNNAEFNSARAGSRVTNEDVAIAKSGYRPTIVGTAGISYSNTKTANFSRRLTTGSYGIELSQILFDGFQTKNNVSAAEAQVKASFESLRNVEANTLFSAAQAYMNVIYERQIAEFRRQNLAFLNEQVRAARARLDVGEGTRTDVAQAEAYRAEAIAQVSAAVAQVKSAEAVYRQVVGEEPGKLDMARPLKNKLSRSLADTLQIAQVEHPAIIATQYAANAAQFRVRSAEGSLLPQISANAGVSRDYQNTEGVASSSLTDGTSTGASVGLQLTIPIYQGGRTSAQIRQAKEAAGQARIDIDVNRDQVRSQAVAAWSAYISASESVEANQTAVSAARLALDGVMEERKVGQRTTLDVLDAQQDVINARITQAASQRDLVLSTYAILQASGKLSRETLSLSVAKADPAEHYKAVKDKWIGLRTPDGR